MYESPSGRIQDRPYENRNDNNKMNNNPKSTDKGSRERRTDGDANGGAKCTDRERRGQDRSRSREEKASGGQKMREGRSSKDGQFKDGRDRSIENRCGHANGGRDPSRYGHANGGHDPSRLRSDHPDRSTEDICPSNGELLFYDLLSRKKVKRHL